MSQPLGKLIGAAPKAVSDKRDKLIEVQLLEMLKIRRPGQHLSGAGIPSALRISAVIAHIRCSVWIFHLAQIGTPDRHH